MDEWNTTQLDLKIISLVSIMVETQLNWNSKEEYNPRKLTGSGSITQDSK